MSRIERLKKINNSNPGKVIGPGRRERAACQRHLTRVLQLPPVSAADQSIIRLDRERRLVAERRTKQGGRAARLPDAEYSSRKLKGWRKKLVEEKPQAEGIRRPEACTGCVANKRLSYAVESVADLVPNMRFRSTPAMREISASKRRNVLGQLNDDAQVPIARGHRGTRRRASVAALPQPQARKAPDAKRGQRLTKKLAEAEAARI